jgi:hypothetical protein
MRMQTTLILAYVGTVGPASCSDRPTACGTPIVMALAEGQADNAEANRWLGPYRGGGTPGIQRCPRQQQLAMSAFSMPEASLGEA